MKICIFILSVICISLRRTESLIYSGCKPLGDWAFSLTCDENSITLVQDAFISAITDNGTLQDSCVNALLNLTAECSPQRNLMTRSLRLACNTMSGPCNSNGSAIALNSPLFRSCSSQNFTYAYAVYDCLPAFNSSERIRNYFYLGSPEEALSSSDKVYLMSTNYDRKEYTTSMISRCSVKVTNGTNLLFRILDLLGETVSASNDSYSNVSCPYELYITNGTGQVEKKWCGQLEWDSFGDNELYIPTNDGGLTVDVLFKGSSSSVRGRVWILVEGNRTDNGSVEMEISCGQYNASSPTIFFSSSSLTSVSSADTTATTATSVTTRAAAPSTVLSSSPLPSSGAANENNDINQTVAVAVGVSVGGLVIISIIIAITICIYICHSKKQPEVVAMRQSARRTEAVSHGDPYLNATALPDIVHPTVTGEGEEEGNYYRQLNPVTNRTYSKLDLDYDSIPSGLRGAEGEGSGASEGGGIQTGSGGTAGGGRVEEERQPSAGLEALGGPGESEIPTHSTINTPNKKPERIKKKTKPFRNAAAGQLQEIFLQPSSHSDQIANHQQLNKRPNDSGHQQNIILEAPEISYNNLQINPLQLIMDCNC